MIMESWNTVMYRKIYLDPMDGHFQLALHQLFRHCHSKAHQTRSFLSAVLVVKTVGNCECYGFGIST